MKIGIHPPLRVILNYAVMQFIQETLFVVLIDALLFAPLGVSGVGRFCPKPDTWHPKPIIRNTVKAKKYRS
jgi:hypothetical protein